MLKKKTGRNPHERNSTRGQGGGGQTEIGGKRVGGRKHWKNCPHFKETKSTLDRGKGKPARPAPLGESINTARRKQKENGKKTLGNLPDDRTPQKIPKKMEGKAKEFQERQMEDLWGEGFEKGTCGQQSRKASLTGNEKEKTKSRISN